MRQWFAGRSIKAGALLLTAVGLFGAAAYLKHVAPERLGLHRLSDAGPAKLSPFLDAAGAPVTIEAFRGKLVVLNLWAQWCAPCIEELPSLDRLAGLLPPDEFAVVALTKDQVGDTVSKRAFDSLSPQHLRFYLDPTGDVAREVGERGLPTTLVLGPDGTPLLYREGETQWDSEDMISLLRKLRRTHSS